MASGLMSRLSRAFKTFEQAIDIILGRGFPPGGLCAIDCNHVMNQVQPSNGSKRSLKDILNDGFLWAVPKCRRSVEKRLNRKFGFPEYNWKPHVPKTNILMCRKCGHDYEAGTLCGYCYEIVKKETLEIQEVIKNQLGLQPVEENIVVLYEGEKKHMSDEFWKKQRIVELPKKRPEWFNQNLLQSTAKEPSDSEDVKTKDLP
ncbi:39S ribosomal protein L32, mitochondrial [Hylaeus anthracinus]|uniref:39S ribosomal protein L32, mitochondrial n=1 Tax=Hylaeus anthracinus TaxID=313031 RepID=UPI0023B96024|nr:39S ribosomal protein L32, mitochondrial [Hylaeus anthracinus]